MILFSGSLALLNVASDAFVAAPTAGAAPNLRGNAAMAQADPHFMYIYIYIMIAV